MVQIADIWPYLLFITNSIALSQLNGDSSGSGSGDDQSTNTNTTNNSTAVGEDETTHENTQQNQTEGEYQFLPLSY